MAPEQAELDASIPDTRWDVYSLGALFYAMVTGDPPRRDSKLSDELKQTERLHHRLKLYRERIKAMPSPTGHRVVAGMDRMLAEIVDHCLALEPAERVRDAGAILAALETRKRQRRQRPLLALAACCALAALGTLAGAGAWIAQSATADAAESLGQQQLKSNRVTAQLAANVLDERLRDRVDTLLSIVAQFPNLAGFIETGAAARRESVGGKEVEPEQLKPLRNWLLTTYQRRAAHQFMALVAVDKDGYVLARAGKLPTGGVGVAPASLQERREKYDRSYAWRNWFNGDRDYYEAQEKPQPMITTPYISQPYVGKYFNRGQTLVNIAIPVRRDGEPVGLLMGNLQWDDFQRWLTEVPFAGGFAVIVNGLGQVLCHQRSSDVRPKPGESAKPFYADSPIPRERPDVLPDFVDPVTGVAYLAAGAPFRPLPERDDRWAVLILNEPATVLAPVTELQQRLHRVGIWCLSIMAVMIGGMFGGLIWTLRREERLAHG
jgi:eukaryotic-like serine/threonine-protein kinase